MKAKTIAIASAPLVLAAALASAGEPARALEPVVLRYTIDVGVDGKLNRLDAAGELPEPLASWLRTRLADYRFLPAKMDGVPQPATTTLYVKLGPVVDATGKPGYRIDTVQTGPDLLRGRLPERQPRFQGAAYFVITYDAAGKVTKATIDEDNDVVGNNQFRKWGLDLARTFRVRPETIAGVGVPGVARVPIVFCMGEPCPTLAKPRPEYGDDLNGAILARSVLRTEAPGEGG